MANYKYALGIDLGTTNTLAYYLKDGRMTPVRFKGNKMMPSVLYVDKAQKVYVGVMAANKGITDPHNMIRSSKKYIGDNENNKTWTLNGLTFTPTDVAAEILKEVRRRFILQVGCDEDEKIGAVITVPAYFNDNRVKETETAGIRAGFEIISIEPEPTMAAMAAARKDTQSDGRTLLVVDIGGGTFDLSVLKANAAANDYQTVDLDGDPALGGDDFDDALVDRFKHLVEDQTGRDLSGAAVSGLSLTDYNKLMNDLREVAKEIKIDLSSTEETEVDRAELLPGYDFHIILSRDEFNEICQGIYDQIFNRTQKFIDESKKFQKQDINRLVLAGGSCYIPYIREKLAEMFPDLVDDGEAERAMLVAYGAAHYAAAIMNGTRINRVSIVAHSFGVMTWDEHSREKILSKIIAKGVSYPCHGSDVFTTTVDNQTEIPVLVYEAGNDNEDKAEIGYHKFYGSIMLDGITPAPKGTARILVAFNYDGNRNLTVTATEVGADNTPCGKTEEQKLRRGEKIELPESAPLDIILLIDKSGSMRGEELTEAKRASHKLVDEMVDFSAHRLSIVAFGDDAELRSGLTNQPELLVPAIDGIEAYGGTNMMSAFEYGAKLLANSGSRERVMIMVTDGYPNTRQKTIQVAQNIKSQGIRLIAIGVGSGVDLDFLTQLVGAENAKQLDNMHELTEAFRSVMQMITKR